MNAKMPMSGSPEKRRDCITSGGAKSGRKFAEIFRELEEIASMVLGTDRGDSKGLLTRCL
jgi:hypothetical protein